MKDGYDLHRYSPDLNCFFTSPSDVAILKLNWDGPAIAQTHSSTL